MGTYRDLRAVGATTRAAASLTGISRATAGRTPRTPSPPRRRAPMNGLSASERAQVITTLDSPRFVDQPPLQVYAQLLDEGTYLCSVSTMYRVLAKHRQVRERRRLARHPARTRPGPGPSSSRPARDRSTPGTSPNSPGRSRAATTTRT